MPMAFRFLIPILFITKICVAQTDSLKILERDLLVKHDTMFHDYFNGDNIRDSLEPLFEQELVHALLMKDAAKYEFSLLTKCLYITTSKDGRLRFFTWDTWRGGTMPYIQVVAQYTDTTGKLYAKVLKPGDTESFDQAVSYDSIYFLSPGNYLVLGGGAASTREHYKFIGSFKINGSQLTDTCSIFETKDGLQPSIYISFESSMEDFKKFEPRYNEKYRSLTFLQEDYEEYKTVSLKFDGHIFRRIKQK